MIDIDLIKKLAHYYGNLASLAQVAPKDSPAKNLEQEQFKKLKDIHAQFLSISKDVGINKILSLFDTFVKISKYLKNESFNPTIKNSLPAIENDVYNIYEKIILEKLKDIYNQYMSMVKNIDAENIETNIGLFMSLMRNFNDSIAGLNVISKPELKNIVAPLYKSILDTHYRVTDMYESTGKRIESVEYQQEEEEEEALSDEELFNDIKDLENEYLNIAGNTNEINIDENIHSLAEIYDEIRLALLKIKNNKNPKSISDAKKIHDRIAKMHNEFTGTADVSVLHGPSDAEKAKAEEKQKQYLSEESKKREERREKNPRERYRDFLIEFKSKSPEEQKDIRRKWYENSLKYLKSEKGKAAKHRYFKDKASKKQKEKRKEKSEKLKDEKINAMLNKLRNFRF